MGLLVAFSQIIECFLMILSMSSKFSQSIYEHFDLFLHDFLSWGIRMSRDYLCDFEGSD